MKASTSTVNANSTHVNATPDQEKELEDAATKIQASFRGHLARKKHHQEQTCQENCRRVGNLHLNSGDELDDVDLSDPELNKAATKIQASFRGHKARKDGQN